MTRITDDEYGKFMWDSIKQLCDDFGPRPPTSEAERQAALSYEKELGKYCNETVVDTFETRPNAYPQGFVRLVAVISCLAFFFFIFTFPFNLLTILLCILGLWIFYSTLFQQKEWIHVLFKKESSQNVFGIIKPQKATRVRVLFGGHMDSAWESGVAKFGKSLFIITFGGAALIPYAIVLSIIKSVQVILGLSFVSLFPITITMSDLIFFIPFFGGWFWLLIYVLHAWGKRTRATLGANDNLSGVAISLGVARYLHEHPLKNIEVWCGAFGCEECGDQGSKAFVAKYGVQGILDDAHAVIPESCGAGKRCFLHIGKSKMKIQTCSNGIWEFHHLAPQMHVDLLKKDTERQRFVASKTK
ncbi:MAG: M28 family peptidase [Candidatus Helarchaeota archaeon]